jgi:hypothetical protein
MRQKQFAPRKPRADSLHELRSRFEKTLASEIADAFIKRLLAWLTNRNPLFFITEILS